jgi:hypothetical protein
MYFYSATNTSLNKKYEENIWREGGMQKNLFGYALKIRGGNSFAYPKRVQYSKPSWVRKISASGDGLNLNK